MSIRATALAGHGEHRVQRKEQRLLTQILILNIPARFSLRLGHVVGLLCEVSNEDFLQAISRESEDLNMSEHTVAIEIAKAALFEHCAMSSSVAMIFLTRATGLRSVEAVKESGDSYVEEMMSQ